MNEIWVYKNECFDVGGGGASVAVYRTLEEAMAAKSNLSYRHIDCKKGIDCPGKWIEVEAGEYVVEYDIPDRGWMKESDLTYSSIQSITKCKFGEPV